MGDTEEDDSMNGPEKTIYFEDLKKYLEQNKTGPIQPEKEWHERVFKKILSNAGNGIQWKDWSNQEVQNHVEVELQTVGGGNNAARRLAAIASAAPDTQFYAVAVPVLALGLFSAWFLRRFLKNKSPKQLIPRYQDAEPEQTAPVRRMSDKILGFTSP